MQAARAPAASNTTFLPHHRIGDRLRAEIHFRFLTATCNSTAECSFQFRFLSFLAQRTNMRDRLLLSSYAVGLTARQRVV